MLAIALVLLALAERFDRFPWLAAAIAAGASLIAFALMIVPGPVSDSFHKKEHLPAALAIALGACGALAGLSGWVAGTPAFAHDWKWPLTPLQSHAQVATLGSLWQLWGSGTPAIEALGNYPVTIASWLLGFIVPSQIALLIVIAAIGAVAGYGAARLGANTGLSRYAQGAAALAVAAMPAFFNRLCAGHIEWLVGYALFPLALATLLERWPRIRAAALLGILWGIAGGQAQFLLFFPLAALPLAFMRRRVHVAGIAFLIALAMQAPAIAAMFLARSANVFAQDHANLSWQLAQSDRLSLALLSGADPAHYFAAWQSAPAYWLALVPLALAGIGASRTPLTRALGAVWLISSLWSAGLYGPLAAPLSRLFASVPDAIFLREFAHAQAITGPIFVILVAHGAESIASMLTAKRMLGAVLAFASLLPLTSAAYSGTVTRLTPGLAASRDRNAIVDELARLPGSGQILWWPGLTPVAMNGTRGGVDDDAFVAGTHAPYSEYRPTSQLAQTVTALDRGDAAACGLLGDLGIEAVVVRDDVRAAPGSVVFGNAPPGNDTVVRAGLRILSRSGAYRAYAVPCFNGRFTYAPLTTLAGDWTTVAAIARRSGATDELTVPPPPPRGCMVEPFHPAQYVTTDPALGWIPLSEFDAQFGDFDNAFDNVYVTSSASLPASVWALAANARQSYEWRTPEQLKTMTARTVAVWKIAACPVRAVRTKPELGVRGTPARALINGKLGLRTSALLVAHYGVFSGWSLRVNGETVTDPRPADGYATGWVLSPGTWNITFVQLGPPIAALWAVVIAACLGALAAAVAVRTTTRQED